jgi:hypothetical protein
VADFFVMTPTIYLALTHDWELRGDGSGDIEEIQFGPLRRLLKIYQETRARTTFLPDVLQQIRFRSLEDQHPELKVLADSWDEHVRAAYEQGHDIQLHLHSQWSDAKYDEGRWELRGDWSLLGYDRNQAASMIAESKHYLESLLRPIDSKYRCVAFRASALALGPSPHLLSTLAGLGIEIDVSMAAGVYLDNETLQLDYRDCEESFLPYYPGMDDARKLSPQREPIVCVPLNHFYGSRRAVTKQNLALVRSRLGRRQGADTASSTSPAPLDSDRAGLGRDYDKLIAPAIKRKYFVSDTGRLNYPLMKEMLASIRERARDSGLSQLPVVITNHPKDVRDWAGLERFVGEIAEAKDLRFITLSELAEKLRSGEFAVRAAGSADILST